MALVASELRASPDLYPLAFDVFEDGVYFVKLSRARYDEASFLDQRINRQSDIGGWEPWDAVAVAAGPLADRGDYIFHVGHVGSTLVARLLGLSPRVFSLREPAVLRTLAQVAFDLPTPESPWSQATFDAHVEVFSKLWSRTYDPRQKTLLKATSLVGEIAAPLMTRSAEARALAMTVAPEVYMATILGGPASRQELAMSAQSRLRRLHRRAGAGLWRLYEMSEGEQAAMSWAAEMAGLVEAARRFPDRIQWLDFERFLAAPGEGLAAALGHLHGEAPDANLQTMLKSPLFGRYSKGLEHAYDANLRRQVLDQARGQHRAELAKGRAWLDRAAREAPVVAEALGVAAPL
ncbi:MAG TPA: hypothetical protein VHZ26_13415 [Caulobacteraceae bacterium]|jgi:hypothetical protein|nr:hypothetical protein [Caulobacteraceae bacterium]